MMTLRRNTRGFTLIEILIALLIFAVIGVIAGMSLKTIINAHNRLKVTDRQLLQLELTMAFMRQDFAQVIDRKTMNSSGSPDAALMSSGSGDISFTRTGLFNPLGVADQSNMERVSYSLEGNQLMRLTWNVLDQPPNAEPEKELILAGVESITWQFVTGKGKTENIWPPSEGSAMQKENHSALPRVVLMVMKLKNNGTVQGVFVIPARGARATSTSP